MPNHATQEYETYEADFFDPNGTWMGSEPVTIVQGHDFEGGLAGAFHYRHRHLEQTIRSRAHKRDCTVIVADDARLGHPLLIKPLV